MKYEEYDTSIVYFIRLIISSFLNENAKEYEERIAITANSIILYRTYISF